jgi:PAS domain S-box-containing protein
MRSDRRSPWELLSARERQLVTSASQGLSDKEIAIRLGIGFGSVKTYWDRIRNKLGVRSRTEVMAVVLRDEYAATISQASTGFELLKSILDQSSFGLALADAKGQQILFANEAFGRICAFLAPELTGHSGIDTKTLQNSCIQELMALHRLSGPSIAGRSGQRFEVKLAEIQLEGRECTLIQLSDVSTLEKTAAEHARAERFYKNILSDTRDAILMTTRRGVILYANDRAYALLNLSRREVVGRRVEELLPHTLEHDLLKTVVEQPHKTVQIRTIIANGDQKTPVEAIATNRLRDPAVRAVTIRLAHYHPKADPRSDALVQER